MKKAQVNTIYWIRTISCLSVVVIHVLGNTYSQFNGIYKNVFLSNIVDILKVLIMFATPTFVFISEFLVSKSYQEIPKGFIKKRFQILFIPYLIWGIFFALDYHIKQGTILDYKLVISSLFSNVVLGYFIDYFILIILQFNILHIILDKYLRRWSAKYVLIIGLIINLSYLAFFNFTEPYNIPLGNYIWDWGYWLPFIGWLFYFLLGYYCGIYYEEFIQLLNKYRKLVLFLPLFTLGFGIGVAFLDLYNISSKRVDNVFYTTSIIFLIFLISKDTVKVPKIVLFISNYSFSIYLLHGIFINRFSNIVYFKQINIIAYAFCLFILSVVGSILLSYFINKFSWGRYIVGRITRKKRNFKSDQPYLKSISK